MTRVIPAHRQRLEDLGPSPHFESARFHGGPRDGERVPKFLFTIPDSLPSREGEYRLAGRWDGCLHYRWAARRAHA